MTIKQLIESLSKIEEKNSEITEIYFSENSPELIIESETEKITIK